MIQIIRIKFFSEYLTPMDIDEMQMNTQSNPHNNSYEPSNVCLKRCVLIFENLNTPNTLNIDININNSGAVIKKM